MTDTATHIDQDTPGRPGPGRPGRCAGVDRFRRDSEVVRAPRHHRRLRPARRRDYALLRRTDGCSRHRSPYPRAPRTGRRSRRRRLRRAASGKLGVAIATSGPGATNLVTAIADAYMDSVPMLAITGQVFSTSMGTDRVPRSGHFRCDDAHYQALVPGDATRGCPPHHQSGSAHRHHRAVRVRSWWISPKTPSRNRHRLSGPEDLDLPGYHPVTKANQKQIQAAAQIAGRGEASGLVRRRRLYSRWRTGRTLRLCQPRRCPRGDHADGPRSLPRLQSAEPRHAGNARNRAGGALVPRSRPAGGHWVARLTTG